MQVSGEVRVEYRPHPSTVNTRLIPRGQPRDIDAHLLRSHNLKLERLNPCLFHFIAEYLYKYSPQFTSEFSSSRQLLPLTTCTRSLGLIGRSIHLPRRRDRKTASKCLHLDGSDKDICLLHWQCTHHILSICQKYRKCERWARTVRRRLVLKVP